MVNSNRYKNRQLRHESLDPRQLMAFAAFNFTLYSDAQGSPGAPIAQDQIQVGDRFFVEVTAQEFDPDAAGLAGISLDLNWDPAVLEVVEEDFDVQKIITDRMPLLKDGELHNDQGSLSNLGGSALATFGAGDNLGGHGAERFAMIPFRALAASGETLLRMREGGSQIVLDTGASPWQEQLRFERQSLVVLPKDPDAMQQSTSAATAQHSATEVFVELESVAMTTSKGAVIDDSVGSGGAELVETDSATVRSTSTSIQIQDKSEASQIAVNLSGDQPDHITFGTHDDLGTLTSEFVRPAHPDDRQSITIRNPGSSALVVDRIEVLARDVHVEAGELPLTIPAGESKQLQVVYAPNGETPLRWRPKWFSLDTGIVIHSNASNAATYAIGLTGKSTFDADVNYDGKVDLADIAQFNNHFGEKISQANYLRVNDPNGDGSVDLGDLGVLNAQYGKQVLATAERPPTTTPLNTESPAPGAMRAASSEPRTAEPMIEVSAFGSQSSFPRSTSNSDELDELIEELARNQLGI